MGNAQKALVMAAGIFLAIALITIAVVMFVSAQDATKTAQGSFSSIQTQLAQTAFTVYDNTTVSGSQVINALRKYEGQQNFGIEVVTGKNGAGAWYGNSVDGSGVVSSSGATGVYPDVTTTGSYADQSSTNYINPSGQFQASLIIDNSKVVRAIVFKQQ